MILTAMSPPGQFGHVRTRTQMIVLAGAIALHVALLLVFYLDAHMGGGLLSRPAGKGRALSVFRLSNDGSAAEGSRAAADKASDRSAEGAPPLTGLREAKRETANGSGEAASPDLLGDALAAALSDNPLAGSGSSSYQSVLRRHIAQYRQSPNAVGGRARFGTAVIRVNVARDGQIIDARVVTTQGANLDEAALGALWRAEPLPAVPASLGAPLSVDVAIEFVRG